MRPPRRSNGISKVSFTTPPLPVGSQKPSSMAVPSSSNFLKWVFPLEQRPAMKPICGCWWWKAILPSTALKRKLFLLAVSSTPGRTISAFCWEKLPLDTPHDWSQGILGSAAAARTSGVIHGLPKRIGSGGSHPTMCTRKLYQAAGVRFLSPSLRIFCAALMSRSWSAPHSGHSQSRT